MQVQMADADGALLSAVNLNEVIRLYAAVSLYSSYPWAATQSTQQFGGLMVILFNGNGHSFVGLFKAAMDITRKWGVGQ